jgi:hypothetical protein
LDGVSETEMVSANAYHSHGMSVHKERLHVGDVRWTTNWKRNERIYRSLVFEY